MPSAERRTESLVSSHRIRQPSNFAAVGRSTSRSSKRSRFARLWSGVHEQSSRQVFGWAEVEINPKAPLQNGLRRANAMTTALATSQPDSLLTVIERAVSSPD